MAAERFSAKRYGVRYGRRLRDKVGKVEKERQDTNVCPYCRYTKKLKRLSAGIWKCTKCKTQFTGRAYYVGSRVVIASTEGDEDKIQQIEEMPEEPEQEAEV